MGASFYSSSFSSSNNISSSSSNSAYDVQRFLKATPLMELSPFFLLSNFNILQHF
jgi:hypothetical protein